MDNGGGGSLINQYWHSGHALEFSISSGTYSWTGDPELVLGLNILTNSAGDIALARLEFSIGPFIGESYPYVDKFSMVRHHPDPYTDEWIDHSSLHFRDAYYTDGWSVRVDDPSGVIPEPSSLVVWSVGLLAGLGVWRRRRR